MLKYKFIPPHRRSAGTSLQTTPEPTPRMSRQTMTPNAYKTLASNSQLNSYGSEYSLLKNNNLNGSTQSLVSTTSSSAYTRRRKGKAPLPPSGAATVATSLALPEKPKHQSTNDLLASRGASPSGSLRGSLRGSLNLRKKRVAPLPPGSSTPMKSNVSTTNAENSTLFLTAQSDVISLEATESTLEESKPSIDEDSTIEHLSPIQPIRKLIPLDASLVLDSENSRLESNQNTNENIVYRRTIVPSSPTDEQIPPITEENSESHDRQWQKMKENKESQNKNRQSQISLSSNSDPNDTLLFSNKSTYGKWKRRKGPAPALPIPSRKSLQMVPLQEIRHELEVIEVQQQGLEKQVSYIYFF